MYAVALKGVSGGERTEDDAVEDDRPESESSLQPTEESLLSLVQPELVALSKSWLAALKDNALLSLPPGMLFKCTVKENLYNYYRS